MSGKIMNFARKGALAERITDMWLSMVGICTPVRREDDYGVDFHCELGDDHEGKYTSYHSPFILQVKTNLEDGIRYGDRNAKSWTPESVDWLFRNKIPLFIGLVDVKTLKLSIYDTSGLWQVYNSSGAWASQIQLVSRFHPEGEMRKNAERVLLEGWEDGKGDGYKHIVDLGNPVVVFLWDEVENEVKMNLKKAHLTTLILFEQKNIISRDLGMRVFLEVKGNEPGGHGVQTGMSFSPHPGLNPDEVIRELYPGLVSLLVKYNSDGRQAELEALKAFLRYAPPYRLDKDLYYADKGLFSYLRESIEGNGMRDDYGI